jgi:nucleoid-associated protein YgaU
MNQRAWDPGRLGRHRAFVLAPSRETLVRRAVCDHLRTAGASGTPWIVTVPVPEHETSARDALHAGYGAWLRTTAAAGIAGALLVTPAPAAASPAGAANGQGVGDALNAPAFPLEADQVRQDQPTGVPEDQPPPATNPALTELENQPSLPLKMAPLTSPFTLQPPQPPQPQTATEPPPLEEQPPPAEQPEAAAEQPEAAAEQPEPAAAQPEAAAEQPEPVAPLPPALQPQKAEAEPEPAPPAEPAAPEAPRTPIPAPPEPAGSTKTPGLTPQRLGRWITMVDRAMDDTGPAAAQAPAAGAQERALVAHPQAKPVPTMGWSYVVQPGDNLWDISEQIWSAAPSNAEVDRTWRVLYEWNSKTIGSDPDVLYPGQVLEIPVDAASFSTTETQ